MPGGGDVAWVFDAKCVLCSSMVHYVLRHEMRPDMRFISIQSAEGQRLAQAHGIDPLDPTSFLFLEDGRASTASDGVLALVRHLRGPARLLRLLRPLPRGWRDRLYYIVARNRYAWFGERETCMVPDAATRQRFVLPDA